MEAIKVDVWLSAFVQNAKHTETVRCCAGCHAWLNSAFRTVRKTGDKKHQVLERPFALSDWSLLGSACPRDLLCWEYG